LRAETDPPRRLGDPEGVAAEEAGLGGGFGVGVGDGHGDIEKSWWFGRCTGGKRRKERKREHERAAIREVAR
jgi:hypothetical protein